MLRCFWRKLACRTCRLPFYISPILEFGPLIYFSCPLWICLIRALFYLNFPHQRLYNWADCNDLNNFFKEFEWTFYFTPWEVYVFFLEFYRQPYLLVLKTNFVHEGQHIYKPFLLDCIFVKNVDQSKSLGYFQDIR